MNNFVSAMEPAPLRAATARAGYGDRDMRARAIATAHGGTSPTFAMARAENIWGTVTLGDLSGYAHFAHRGGQRGVKRAQGDNQLHRFSALWNPPERIFTLRHCRAVPISALVGGASDGDGTSSLSAKLAGCTTDAVDSGSQGVVLPDFAQSFKGTLDSPSHDCAGLLGPALATGSITFKWKAAGFTLLQSQSTMTVTSGDVQAGVWTSLWGAVYGGFGIGVYDFPSGTAGTPVGVTGGFTGGDASLGSSMSLSTQET
jgi:hypothetical protein